MKTDGSQFVLQTRHTAILTNIATKSPEMFGIVSAPYRV